MKCFTQDDFDQCQQRCDELGDYYRSLIESDCNDRYERKRAWLEYKECLDTLMTITRHM